MDLSTSLTADAPALVGDATRLQQVAWNLITNAIKFTPAGGRIHVTLAHSEGDLVFAVSDTGVGITSAFLPYVFDLFRQEEPSTNRQHGGLGLGLSIVRRLVELHGGRVVARSQGQGQGATFEVRLPCMMRGSSPSPEVEEQAADFPTHS